jgi:hypothetical protein
MQLQWCHEPLCIEQAYMTANHHNRFCSVVLLESFLISKVVILFFKLLIGLTWNPYSFMVCPSAAKHCRNKREYNHSFNYSTIQ